MMFANKSPAKSRVIILDSCHSGIAGNRPEITPVAEIKSGTTILTASTEIQSSLATGSGSVFTNLLLDALNGGAANLVGAITLGSVYAHIDQSLGPWGQRPVFKTNVNNFVSLRDAVPPIALAKLQLLAVLFPTPGYQFALDPQYEPERVKDAAQKLPPPDPVKTTKFAILQSLVRVGLVRPVGAPHMWHAAMESKACELTVLGEHYRRLVAEGLI
jgi:hypothetical protein